jgi:putative restriction endonuclease
MGLGDITREAVLNAVAEHDRLGDKAFRATYGFGPARRYVLSLDGRTYSSKAIAGAAHRYVTGVPLRAAEFSGGEATVVARLTSLGFAIRDSRTILTATEKRLYGEIPGIPEGTQFGNRVDASNAKVHRARQAGIVGTGDFGAESIVVSGGYEDDEDNGTEIIYTGHGGRGPNGAQVADQTFDTSGNSALVTSQLTGKPVRVIRGQDSKSPHAPLSGYRYDGLFRVEDAWHSRGRSGFLVCRYRLVKVDAESLPVAPTGTNTAAAPGPDGNVNPGRRASTVQRIVRSTSVVDFVKSIHDHTCQACGARLTIGPRGYSEGAHIKALGRPHLGPDIPSNVLCLCPNCHVLFDGGALIIANDLAIMVNGAAVGTLRTHSKHAVDSDYLAYHRGIHR